MRRRRNTKGLESAIGYQFRDRALLDRALTHASTRSEQVRDGDNERLEFLGDRVLGLAIADILIKRDPSASEGALARRFNRLVRKDACARVGRSLDLGAALYLSAAEDESGGREKPTILADAVEALLAAIYLEAGFDSAREVVARLWEPLIEGLPDMVADAKSMLQEWAQGRGLPLPRYVEIKREGPDHAPHFSYEVRIDGKKPAKGDGTSKRAAEQAAATAMLAREGLLRGGAGNNGK